MSRPKLYTSLVHAKLTLNGGELRPMTPIPEKYHDIIDPEFTIGLGALREVEGKGLQCPMRGCGKWYHNFGDHMTKAHGDRSGKDLKRILQIPSRASLVSMELSEKLSVAARRRCERGDNPVVGWRGSQRYGARRRKNFAARSIRSRKTASDTSRLAGTKNLLNSCEAQIAHRLLDLEHKLGRSPTANESDVLDPSLRSACTRIYGSWNSAKIVVGLELFPTSAPTYDRDSIVTLFAEYYVANGHLPTSYKCKHRGTHPLLPSAHTIRRYFPGKSWPEIMDHVAWKIGVTDGRYGKPEYAKKETAVA